MELKDLVITPLLIIVVYFLAYQFRPIFTNEHTKPLFIPALSLKVFGAIMLGVLYQFYYDGGDTFNYYKQAGYIYQAFYDSPLKGLKLLLSGGEYHADTFKYAQYIHWYNSPTEYFVVKLTGLFALFTFNTYSSIGVIYALISFGGLWAAYLTFLKEFPALHRPIGLAIFFFPSVFFWGSGLIKDTVALAALGWMFFAFYQLFIEKKRVMVTIVILLIAIISLYSIRKFVLLSFLPPAVIWAAIHNSNMIKTKWLRYSISPFLIIIGVMSAWYIASNITEGDTKYDIDAIGARTKINAEYLYRISLQEGGSAYYLGEMDGSMGNLLRLAPKALVVTIFRPYLWEVKNPLMLLSALESTLFILLFFRLLIRPGPISTLRIVLRHPLLIFCITYSVILAIAIGLNSYNFGSLVRYKVQILPFLLSSLLIIANYRSHVYKLNTDLKTAR